MIPAPCRIRGGPRRVSEGEVEIEPTRLFPDNYLISDSITALPYLLPVAALALVLPPITYRRRDALFLLVPFWNIAFSGVVCWRLAGLPHVDWPLRKP